MHEVILVLHIYLDWLTCSSYPPGIVTLIFCTMLYTSFLLIYWHTECGNFFMFYPNNQPQTSHQYFFPHITRLPSKCALD